jgi:hypothetical protein
MISSKSLQDIATNGSLLNQTLSRLVQALSVMVLPVANGGTGSAVGALRSPSVTGIGYTTGAGGTVTQATSKSTGVTLDTACGDITMNAAALAGDTTVNFTLTNSNIGASDVLILNHISAGTPGSYLLNGRCGAGFAIINVRNITTGSLSQAIVIRFALIKAATA